MRVIRWMSLALLVLSAWPVEAEQGQKPLTGKLLYTRLTEGTWQIWQKDLATGEDVQVTAIAGDKRCPLWGGNGQVAYCTTNHACFENTVGSQAHELRFRELWPARDLARSPDGQWLVFSKFRTDLPDQANLWVAKGDESNPRMITQEPGLQQQPAWSPGSTKIAYSGGQGPNSYEIFVVNADGTDRAQLTTNEANDFLPAWSPDGRQIAYASNASGDDEIWVVEADGSRQAQLTHSPGLDTHPAWSPDGRSIAFATNRTGEMEIWVMNADGSDQQLLLKAEGGACDPAWR
ncbi:MAG: TolB family protein [Candidatus Omnitrophica bacterium]|nr:TolB family protein [Candidatus Omnitrophota bacterium]